MAHAQKLSAKEVYATFRPSVVRIDTDDAFGCGVVFRKLNWILTCAHVVDGAKKKLTVTDDDGKELDVIEVAENRDADVALLILPAVTNAKPMEPARFESLSTGDDVYAIGSPQGLDDTLSTGVISALRTAKDINLVQISNAVTNGNSGGPVITSDGKLAGIVSFTFDQKGNLNFAIAAETADTLLSEAPRVMLAKFMANNAANPPAEEPSKDGEKRREPTKFEKTFWSRMDRTLSGVVEVLSAMDRDSAQPLEKARKKIRQIPDLSPNLRALCDVDLIAGCPALQSGSAQSYLTKMQALMAQLDIWVKSGRSFAEAVANQKSIDKFGKEFLAQDDALDKALAEVLKLLIEINAIQNEDGLSLSPLAVGYLYGKAALDCTPDGSDPGSCLIGIVFSGPLKSGDVVTGVRPLTSKSPTKVVRWNDLGAAFMAANYKGKFELEVQRNSKTIKVEINLSE